MKRILTTTFLFWVLLTIYAQSTSTLFKLNSSGYYNYKGVDAMAFNDYYPEGHQGGISLIMHGRRMVTNGDLRFEPTPGQWQPVPRKLESKQVDGSIVTTLSYPDSTRHLTGFNPMVYPDVQLQYNVTLTPRDKGFEVTVDLESPIPTEFIGKVGFNLEFFPGWLFGHPWIMDGQSGIFPQQPNGPIDTAETYMKNIGDFHIDGRPIADISKFTALSDYSPLDADKIVATPYAVGQKFTSCPDDPYSRLTITSFTEPLKLYDGRMNHNNGWFVLRSEIAAGKTKGAVRWYIEPSVVEDWSYKPVIQTSQIGYAPNQQKVAIIETDISHNQIVTAKLLKYTSNGEELVREIAVKPWDGTFLRYKYLLADFSDITESGLYKIKYAENESPVFRISDDVYDRGVWQPVIEYFLPVQMCHMRVAEKYRIWHDRCHMDDATMAVEGNYFDGYVQYPIPSNVTPGDVASHINVGGWHDAGDFDLRIESQIGESYILSKAWEKFHPEIDVTTIDQKNHNVEIHQPDGKNDILQQIENGALTVVNSYLALGRLYRGIICHTLRQYAMLGDASAMTDGIIGNADDRWVFTEDNPGRELSAAAGLAGTSVALRNYNDTLSAHCLKIAEDVFAQYLPQLSGRNVNKRLLEGAINAAVELHTATGSKLYSDFILSHWNAVLEGVPSSAWCTSAFAKTLEGNKKYNKQIAAYRKALVAYSKKVDAEAAQTPYGVPYRPDIWGAGWTIQSFGYNHYFLVDSYPDLFSPAPVLSALSFVLGCHPGTNQASFASGVGSKSATVGYGLNRADWSYIPGGVISGTALIRPDFPELLEFPFLWQQTEYVLGGGSSHYMFLVLAAQKLSHLTLNP